MKTADKPATANMINDNCQSVSRSMKMLPAIISSTRSSSAKPALENMRTTSTSLETRVIKRPVCIWSRLANDSD